MNITSLKYAARKEREMTAKVDFYCWVKWNTCRKAKEFLSQKNVEINERDFFKNLFNREEIEELLQGRPASEMFNFRSPSFKKLGMEREKLSDNELIDLMLKEPRLVRRPVVRIGDKVHFNADKSVLESLIVWSGWIRKSSMLRIWPELLQKIFACPGATHWHIRTERESFFYQ